MVRGPRPRGRTIVRGGRATAATDPAAFREFERQGHDRVARSYGDFFEPVTAKVIEPLLDAAGVRLGSRTVDIASGPGSVAAAAAARGAEVVGIDLSPQMVAVARALDRVRVRSQDGAAGGRRRPRLSWNARGRRLRTALAALLMHDQAAELRRMHGGLDRAPP